MNERWFRFVSRLAIGGVLCGGVAACASLDVLRGQPAARVVTYPGPAEEVSTSDYRVEVNGRPVDVYRAESQYFDKKYYFASFDFSGDVTVRVTSTQSLARVKILPERFGIQPKVEGPNALSFSARQPFRIAIERDGRNSPLLVFGNPLETNLPQPGDTNVVYFGPGVHKPVKVRLTDNQTLYLAGGAVVKGCVEARGSNITVRGRGILDGNDYPHLKGPAGFMLNLAGCRNLVVRDVIVRGPWTWAVVPAGCDGVLIDNVKICGSRVLNDDGIDVVNSRDVTVRNCFIRTQDDCIAVKGLDGWGRKPSEKMVIESCEFWTDRANIFRIGYECEAAEMSGLVARDIDVLHYSMNYRPPEAFWCNTVFFLQPSGDMPMRDLRFENIRIHADDYQTVLVLAKPMVCGVGGRKYTASGRLSACVFKDIEVTGNAERFGGEMCVVGADERRNVEDVTFENVRLFGNPVSEKSAAVTVGAHTRNIRFLSK